MIWVSVLAGVVGFLITYALGPSPRPEYGAYLSIAALAGLDAVIGGARATGEGTFQSKIFVSGFLSTAVLAVLLTWFGERIGVQIGLATVFVFVNRIMQNLAVIRRHLLDHDYRAALLRSTTAQLSAGAAVEPPPPTAGPND
jgi:small basic protein